MENYIDQMIAHRETLVFQVKTLESDLKFADGLVYSGITLKISRIQQEIKAVNDEIHRYTFVGPEFPEWVRNQRHREQVDTARKTRIQSTMKKIEQLFGGKSGSKNY